MANKTSFSCGKSLDITQAEKLQKRLLGTLEKRCDIDISGDQVERTDTAGLQMLVGFCLAAAQQGLTIHWKNPSDTLISSARRLGISAAIGLNECSD